MGLKLPAFSARCACLVLPRITAWLPHATVWVSLAERPARRPQMVAGVAPKPRRPFGRGKLEANTPYSTSTRRDEVATGVRLSLGWFLRIRGTEAPRTRRQGCKSRLVAQSFPTVCSLLVGRIHRAPSFTRHTQREAPFGARPTLGGLAPLAVRLAARRRTWRRPLQCSVYKVRSMY